MPSLADPPRRADVVIAAHVDAAARRTHRPRRTGNRLAGRRHRSRGRSAPAPSRLSARLERRARLVRDGEDAERPALARREERAGSGHGHAKPIGSCPVIRPDIGLDAASVDSGNSSASAPRSWSRSTDRGRPMHGGARLAADRGLAQLIGAGHRAGHGVRRLVEPTRRRAAAARSRRHRSPPCPLRRAAATRLWPSTTKYSSPTWSRSTGGRTDSCDRRAVEALPARRQFRPRSCWQRQEVGRCSARDGARCPTMRSIGTMRSAERAAARRAGVRIEVVTGRAGCAADRVPGGASRPADGFASVCVRAHRGLDVLRTMMPRPAFESAGPRWNGWPCTAQPHEDQRRPMATVTFDHLTKRYSAEVIAVNDLNLEIADGEFLVLVGPSGCGKTTAPAHGRRAGGDHRRQALHRRPGRQRRPAQGPRHRHGLPELRALSAHDRAATTWPSA